MKGEKKSRRRRRERLRRNYEGENFCILCPKYIIIGLVRDFITVIMNEKKFQIITFLKLIFK